MKQYPLSPGRLSLAIEALKLLNEKDLPYQSLLSLLNMKSEIFNKPLVSDGLSLMVDLGLVSQDGVSLSLTKKGANLAADTEEEVSQKRRLLALILTNLRRDLLWVAAVPNSELSRLSPTEFQCFKDLGLTFPNESEGALEWWDFIRKAGSFRDNSESKKIAGDAAERLSLDFEKARLESEGRQDVSHLVSWVSRDSDLLGYDILSFMPMEKGVDVRKHVEVKKLSSDFRGSYFFFLSVNEFEIAKQLAKNYFFHLWIFNGSSRFLYELPADDICNLVPDYECENFAWQSAVVYPNLTSPILEMGA
jgi:hypothetical protein